MKKTITLLLVLGLMAFSPDQTQPKKYRFELTEAQVSLLWYTIDNSEASHVGVKELQKLLADQYNAQKDTTKQK